jgi:Domain of unknown function (DUF4032)/Lipopolysaccharide kinase (Kdo/WaaP) family
VARREYAVLRHLETLGLPAVVPVGLAESPERGTAMLVTEYLAHSIQYRRLLMRLPAGPGGHRDRLLDAMASLLVDLHRGGVFWGDCSLANTLFRRDGDRIQASLVDAETSEVQPSLSNGQRSHDLDILVENVAFGLADLAILRADRAAGLGGASSPESGGREPLPPGDPFDEAIAAAEGVRERYEALWDELHAEHELRPDDRHAVRSRVRRLNDLGFSVDEIALEPGATGDRLRLRVAVTTRRFHAQELERRTGLVALEGQARLLMNDLREYGSWLAWAEDRPIDDAMAASRWFAEVYAPVVARLSEVVRADRDLVQAYCDVLEHKWLESEWIGRDVGLAAALESYIALGAPSPEEPAG